MKDTLNARFRAPLPDYYRRRIIVWKDEAGEFADTVADLHLENARVLTMRPNALFELRRQIEASGKVGQATFVEDINANAKGYEYLYRLQHGER